MYLDDALTRMKEYPVEGARLGGDSDDEGAMVNVGGPQEVCYICGSKVSARLDDFGIKRM